MKPPVPSRKPVRGPAHPYKTTTGQDYYHVTPVSQFFRRNGRRLTLTPCIDVLADRTLLASIINLNGLVDPTGIDNTGDIVGGNYVATTTSLRTQTVLEL
jgi:hypothetical protein